MMTAQGLPDERKCRMVVGRSLPPTLAFIALLLAAGLGVNATGGANHVFPAHQFGQSLVAFLLFLVLLVAALPLGIRRLLRKRFVEALAMSAAVVGAIWFDSPGAGAYLKFLLHRSEYRSMVQADETASPKYRVFSWG